MKKYLFLQGLALLLLACLSVTGQTIRFTDTTNKWLIVHASWSTEYPNFGIQSFEAGDTLMEWGGKQYTVIRSGSEFKFWVREDTTTRKIYFKAIQPLGHYDVRDTGEFLYMDFGLAVGDSITMPIVNYGATNNLSTHTVTEADSVLIGSQWHKRLRLTTKNLGYEYYDYYEITEGIGPFAGPLIATRYSSEWGPGQIRCFSNNGTIPTPPFTANCLDAVSIYKKQLLQKKFTIYPNPASGKITVRSKAGYAKGTELILSDLTGRRLLLSPLNNEIEIATTQLPPGLYLLQILQQGVLVQVEKVAVQ